MTAQKQFKELGYKLKEYEYGEIIYIYEIIGHRITFSKDGGWIRCEIINRDNKGNVIEVLPGIIFKKTLAAINKQCEELGWF